MRVASRHKSKSEGTLMQRGGFSHSGVCACSNQISGSAHAVYTWAFGSDSVAVSCSRIESGSENIQISFGGAGKRGHAVYAVFSAFSVFAILLPVSSEGPH